ncbi:hypothetical protein KC363_g7802 [Hortaea werneckii]|nr:hypothetical protein KC361_g8377 [Hortaea werneckii]KAI6882593.1 hypothetical protein KC325_g5689 [Hortaea werneckii]KAI6991473.1 hypothetical protein KC359_g6210 [Hortaea werneckii]KAI7144183.1 hypothetical protein KC344_g5618 [Hortaea werneckii]KAI7172224.1 hypothetical protein KC360_g5684 [Hortaea werneckii]
MGVPSAAGTAQVHHQMLRNPVSPWMSGSEHGLPVRHPRPMTAAEMYLECEKEQEAVVNRLTRELTALRARSASVASNTSHSSNSTGASLLPVDISDPNPAHQMTGPTHPTPSRDRSSSSVSGRSVPASTNGAAPVPGSGVPTASTQTHAGSTTNTMPTGSVSQASADRAAAASGGLSRQPSVSASGGSTPARSSLDLARQGAMSNSGTLYTLSHRPSLSRDPSYASARDTVSVHAQAGTPSSSSAPIIPHPLPSPAQSPGASASAAAAPAMQSYIDPTAHYRTEMDIVKAENEMLRHRVKTLERALRARRRDSSQSDASARPADLNNRITSSYGVVPISGGRESLVSSPAGVAAWAAGDGGVGGVAGPRERSESQSTTASSSRRAVGVAEEEVRVGESAGSGGVGRMTMS